MTDAISHVPGLRNDELVDLRDEKGRYVITVTGEIDITNAPRLHERLIGAMESSASNVIVDLSRVSFIDSSGLGVLVNARQRARSLGAMFRLILPQGHARFPFEVTGLAFLFEEDKSAEEHDAKRAEVRTEVATVAGTVEP